jgi:hypothetical protein
MTTGFAAQFRVVVNFAVEDDGGVAIFAGDGLIPTRDVDDPQTDCSQRHRIRAESALLVWAPMNQAGDCAANPVVIRAKRLTREASNSAHVEISDLGFAG